MITQLESQSKRMAEQQQKITGEEDYSNMNRKENFLIKRAIARRSFGSFGRERKERGLLVFLIVFHSVHLKTTDLSK